MKQLKETGNVRKGGRHSCEKHRTIVYPDLTLSDFFQK